MGGDELEANKQIVRDYVAAQNRRDFEAVKSFLHEDFVWNTAIVADDAPNEIRPLQSNTLRSLKLPHKKPRFNREETLAIFEAMYEGQYRDALANAPDGKNSEGHGQSEDERHLKRTILAMTAEGDRVAVEATSFGYLSHAHDRPYNNFYHNLYRIRDGKIVLFKEYQDTLHALDYVID
jgi:ketosteroid isomerase-like protein